MIALILFACIAAGIVISVPVRRALVKAGLI